MHKSKKIILRFVLRYKLFALIVSPSKTSGLMKMKKAVNLSHMVNANKNTIRNRKNTLKERMARVINNSTLPVSEKVFVKHQMMSIFEELKQIYDVHGI